MTISDLLYGIRPKVSDLMHLPALNKVGTWDERLRLLAPGHLVACWPLREASGTAVRDVSGNTRHGVYSGSPTLNQPGLGDGGSAVYMEGITAHAALYSDSLRDVWTPAEFTISIWAKPDAPWSNTTYRPLLTFGTDTNNFVALHKQSTANRFDVIYKAGGVNKYIADLAFAQTDWFNIAATVSVSNDSLVAYLNGIENGNRVTSGLGTWAGDLVPSYCCIGPVNTFNGIIGWRGWAAYACVWDCVLTDDQIMAQAHMTFPTTPTLSAYGEHVLTVEPAHLLGYWTQGEAGGRRAYDSSGNARHGVYYGVTLPATGAGDGMTAAEYTGGSVYANPHTIDLAGAFNGAEGSLLVFANRDGGWSDATAATLVMFGADSNNLIWINKSNSASRVDVFRKAGGTLQYQSNLTFAATDWTCIAMSWSVANDSLKFYVDGQRFAWLQEDLAAYSGTLARSICTIGANNHAGLQPFIGRLAHVQLYDTALTDTEMADLANIERLTQQVVLWQGSSISVGGNASTYALSQPGLADAWLRANYPARFFVSANASRGGSASWNALARMNYYTLSVIPDYVSIDFHNDSTAVPTGNEALFWYRCREAWIRRLWTAAPDCNISITIWPIVEANGTIGVDGTYQTAIKALAANYGIPVIDVHNAIRTLLAGGHAITEYYNYPTDRTHPLDAGHAVGAALLEAELPTIIAGARQFGTGSTLPDRLNDSSEYEHGTELYEPGTLYTSKTGTWTTNYQGMTSTEANATIVYAFTGCSVGIEAYASGIATQVCDYQIDAGDWVTTASISHNGLRVADYGAHTITLRVRTGGSLNIFRFLAV